eukprot:1161994-Pelagomonas_calceolata.AAC.3
MHTCKLLRIAGHPRSLGLMQNKLALVTHTTNSKPPSPPTARRAAGLPAHGPHQCFACACSSRPFLCSHAHFLVARSHPHHQQQGELPDFQHLDLNDAEPSPISFKPEAPQAVAPAAAAVAGAAPPHVPAMAADAPRPPATTKSECQRCSFVCMQHHRGRLEKMPPPSQCLLALMTAKGLFFLSSLRLVQTHPSPGCHLGALISLLATVWWPVNLGGKTVPHHGRHLLIA